MRQTQLLFILFLFLLIGCKQSKHGNPPVEDSPYSPFVSSSNVIGEWYYSFPFYSSKLTLLEDGTFQFFERGCVAKGYSEGKWNRFGNEIILQSFEKFAEEQKVNSRTVTTTDLNRPRKPSRKDTSQLSFEIDSAFFNVTTTFSFPDSLNVYFEHERLVLIDGYLNLMDRDGLFTKRRFCRIDGYRMTPELHIPTLFDTSTTIYKHSKEKYQAKPKHKLLPC